jgi:hypothetical protein
VVVASCDAFAGVPRNTTPLPGFVVGLRLWPTTSMLPLPVVTVALFRSIATGAPVFDTKTLAAAGVTPCSVTAPPGVDGVPGGVAMRVSMSAALIVIAAPVFPVGPSEPSTARPAALRPRLPPLVESAMRGLPLWFATPPTITSFAASPLMLIAPVAEVTLAPMPIASAACMSSVMSRPDTFSMGTLLDTPPTVDVSVRLPASVALLLLSTGVKAFVPASNTLPRSVEIDADCEVIELLPVPTRDTVPKKLPWLVRSKLPGPARSRSIANMPAGPCVTGPAESSVSWLPLKNAYGSEMPLLPTPPFATVRLRNTGIPAHGDSTHVGPRVIAPVCVAEPT